MSNHLHYIEHTHQTGHGILTKFTCKGDRTSPCHQYPDCDCEHWDSDAEHEREHPSVPHDQCWVEPWMDECATLCAPDGEPVHSGPITVTFNGDCVEWEYANDKDVQTRAAEKARSDAAWEIFSDRQGGA